MPPRYNIAPAQTVLALGRDRQGAHVTHRAGWGFQPHWLPGHRKAPINARVEGVRDKPLFRRACERGRCLIPTDGWFEWRAREDGGRQPYFFHLPQDPVFFFAGLAARDANGRTSVAIVTTVARGDAAVVHPRMPVMLASDDAAAGWLDAESAEAAVSAVPDEPGSGLAVDPVSRRVNRPANDDPACLRAPTDETPGAGS
jgi:putative SOS response-associated peptidase YedK